MMKEENDKQKKLALWEVQFGDMERRTISGATMLEVAVKANDYIEEETKDWRKAKWSSLNECKEAYQVTKIKLLAIED